MKLPLYIYVFIWLYTLKPFNDDMKSHLPFDITIGESEARVSGRTVDQLNSFLQ